MAHFHSVALRGPAYCEAGHMVEVGDVVIQNRHASVCAEHHFAYAGSAYSPIWDLAKARIDSLLGVADADDEFWWAEVTE